MREEVVGNLSLSDEATPEASVNHRVRESRPLLARKSRRFALTRRGFSVPIRSSCSMAAAIRRSRRRSRSARRRGRVICVKGSGWTWAISSQRVSPPSVCELRRLRKLDKLSTRTWSTPARQSAGFVGGNPSVENLAACFPAHKFIDHTHSTAVLA